MDVRNINASNIDFVEELQARWREDPASVPVEWQRFFSEHDDADSAAGRPETHEPAPSLRASHDEKQGRIEEMIWAFRDVGYLHADLNPLQGYVSPGLRILREKVGGQYEALSPDAFGLRRDDMETEFVSAPHLTPASGTLRDIHSSLNETYCGSLGVEFLHIQNMEMRRWIIENIETNNNRPKWSPEQKRAILSDLIRAEEFELFLHSKFVGQKRFSVEGSESLIPALNYLMYVAAPREKVLEIVLGMSHRGRLNVLANSVGKPYQSLFATFSNADMPFEYSGSGDVRYHLGYSTDHTFEDGRSIHIGLVANPSHLEAVDPIVQGKARGIQQRRKDFDRSNVVPILVHGDAAFAGQGIVAETFNMSQLRGYHTGGTIHIIVNNQIGFTTGSGDARSTFFPTDVAKSMPVPIFHVNGHDPEQVVRAVDLALRFRQKFHYDAVIDIFCYRKHGHNESDDPTFTHPVMYGHIKDNPSVIEVYGKALDESGVMPTADQDAFRRSFHDTLGKALEESKSYPAIDLEEAFQGKDWSGFTTSYDHTPVNTAITPEMYHRLTDQLSHVPDHLQIHRKLARIIVGRRKQYREGTSVDWASAEALSFASLLVEGTPVRLSGEDSSRGTFSQRHAIWWSLHNSDPEPYEPLNHLDPEQAHFCVYDSPLSEYSVLGFDYGYAIAQPKMLVLWEAQFGDFCNGAQVIIDQFVAAAESKWDRSNGLVMLLPHGYSGQGPEHSSAHLERFLQLCAVDNMQVCNLTTPAQYFHVLRRQMRRRFRKPLVIMTPKSLLRDARAVSRMADFTEARFCEVLDDAPEYREADSILLCSGQVYYDLAEKREALQARNTAIIRLEQLYPFPADQLKIILGRYTNAQEFLWVQEEPRNRGAWTFMREHIGSAIDQAPLRYVGRPQSASPATGSFAQHTRELEALLKEAFNHSQMLRKAV